METIILPTDRCQALSQKKVQCHRQTKDRSGFCAIHRHFGGNFETIKQIMQGFQLSSDMVERPIPIEIEEHSDNMTGAIQITKDMYDKEEKIAEKCIITDIETNVEHICEKNKQRYQKLTREQKDKKNKKAREKYAQKKAQKKAQQHQSTSTLKNIWL